MECILSAPKEDTVIKTIRYRKLHEIDTDAFISDLQDIEIISQTEDVNQMVDLYETTLSKTLNKHVPTLSKTIVTRPKKPWYSDSVKQQKQVVRKREKTMRKYKHHHHWKHIKLIEKTTKSCLTPPNKRHWAMR